MNTEVLMQLATGLFMLLASIEAGRYLFSELDFNTKWIRIPFAVVLLSFGIVAAFTALLVLVMGPPAILIALSIGLGICFGIFHPAAALAILISNLIMRPWELLDETGPLGFAPRGLAAVAHLSWMASLFIRRDFTLVWSRGLSLLTGFSIFLIFSASISADADENISLFIKSFIPVYLVCYLLTNSLKKSEDLNLIKRVLAISLTGVLATAIIKTMGHPNYGLEIVRLEGPGLMGNSNDLAALAVFAGPFFLIQILDKYAVKKIAWLELICLGVVTLALVMTKSRGGVLSFGLSGLVFLFMHSKSKLKLLIRLSYLTPFVILFFSVALKRDASDLEGSSESRFNYMITGFKMLRDHPVFGVGLFNYPYYYQTYTTEFIEEGVRNAHSVWVQLLSENGLIGIVLFGILFFATAKRAWLIRYKQPEFVMAMIGYGITMTFLNHAYILYPYLLIFTTLAAVKISNLTEQNKIKVGNV